MLGADYGFFNRWQRYFQPLPGDALKPAAFQEIGQDQACASGFGEKKEDRLAGMEVGIASPEFTGMPDCYKIKLRSAGYRLIYRVDEQEVFVTVIAVGRRDKQKVYETARSRL